MRYRPSLSFVCAMTVLFAAGAVGAWAWHQIHSVPLDLRAQMGFGGTLQFKPQPVRTQSTPQQLAERHRQSLALKDKLAAEFPALHVTSRPVPDDANGFLLLHQLSGSSGFPLSEEFKQILSRDAAWDPEAATRCLTESADLVSRIERIASLTTRSSSNMPADYRGFIKARTGKTCCDILLLKARLAAQAGDDPEARRLVAAAGNVGFHYHEVECPSLLSETVAILIDLEVGRVVFKTLLPALGRHADLGRWQATLGKRSYSTADLAQVMRGEWNVSAEHLSLPLMLAEESDHRLPDAEAVARVGASWFNRCVTRLPAGSLADVDRAFQPAADVSHLSKEGREWAYDYSAGSLSWAKGYVRAAAVHAQYLAALELLILERAGATLAATAAARITRDPLSGAAFEFDAAKRVLAAPSATAKLEIEPLALPW